VRNQQQRGIWEIYKYVKVKVDTSKEHISQREMMNKLEYILRYMKIKHNILILMECKLNSAHRDVNRYKHLH
jgi:hypothetical protein